MFLLFYFFISTILNGAQQNIQESIYLEKNFEIETSRDFIEKNVGRYITANDNKTIIEFVNECNLKKNKPVFLNLLLQYSVRMGNYELFRLLIQAGADINFVDEYLRTNLFYALIFPVNLKITLYLLNNMDKSKITRRDSFRKNALSYLFKCCRYSDRCECKIQILKSLLNSFKGSRITRNIKETFKKKHNMSIDY